VCYTLFLFDITVDNKSNLILVGAAIFWATGSPLKLGIPVESHIAPFRCNFWDFLHYYSCFWVVGQWNIKTQKIIMNIIDDVIVTSLKHVFLTFFAIYSLCCDSFSKLSSKIYCIFHCATSCDTIVQCDAIMTSSNTNWVSCCNAEH